jgi:hypothetical protein
MDCISQIFSLLDKSLTDKEEKILFNVPYLVFSNKFLHTHTHTHTQASRVIYKKMIIFTIALIKKNIRLPFL